MGETYKQKYLKLQREYDKMRRYQALYFNQSQELNKLRDLVSCLEEGNEERFAYTITDYYSMYRRNWK